MIVSQYRGKYNRLKNNACNTLKKKNAGYREETEFVSRSLARLRHWNHKHIEKEKSMGINTIRLYICHHRILRTIFLHIFRFGYEILVFCWIGLDLILVLIPFCFRFLGSPWKCSFHQFSIFYFVFFFFFPILVLL